MGETKTVRQTPASPDMIGDQISYWDSGANGFLLHVEGKTEGDGRMIRDEILHPRMLFHLRDVQEKLVLDIGGGDGILSRAIAKKGAKIINGEPILLLAKQASKGEPAVPSVQLNATEILPIKSESVDLAVSNLVLMWLPEIKTVAEETFRILKPGGRFSFSVTHPMVNLGEFDMTDSDRPMLKLQAPLDRGVWMKMINGTNGPYPYWQRTPAEYVNTFIDAGFHLLRGHGLDDVYFPDDFVAAHPEYRKHNWYPLFFIVSLEK